MGDRELVGVVIAVVRLVVVENGVVCMEERNDDVKAGVG